MKTPPVPTRSIKDLVQSSIERDPAFKAELLREGRCEPNSLVEAILKMADDIYRVRIMDAKTHVQITTLLLKKDGAVPESVSTRMQNR